MQKKLGKKHTNSEARDYLNNSTTEMVKFKSKYEDYTEMEKIKL